MSTFEVTAHSPEHEAAILRVVNDPYYAYVPKEYPKAVNGELALDAAHEARLRGEPETAVVSQVEPETTEEKK